MTKLIAYVALFSINLRLYPDFLNPVVKTFFGDFLLIGLIVLLFTTKKLVMHKNVMNAVLYGFLFLAFLFIQHFLLTLYFDRNDFNWITFVGHLRIFYFILLYVFYSSLLTSKVLCEKELVRIIDLSFFVIICIAFIQYLKIPLLYSIVELLFSDDKLKTYYDGNARIFSTYYNANWFGIYLSFMLCYYLSIFLNAKFSIILLVKITLLFLLLLLTGSRTGLILSSFISLFILFYKMIIHNRSIIIFFYYIIFYIILISMIFIVFINYSNYFGVNQDRFNWIPEWLCRNDYSLLDSDIIGITSRYNQWMITSELIYNNPILGYGSFNLKEQIYPHNSYLMSLFSYGILGSTICVILFLVIVGFSLKRCESTPATVRKRIKMTIISSTLCLLIASCTAEYLFVTQIMSFYLLFLSYPFLYDKI